MDPTYVAKANLVPYVGTTVKGSVVLLWFASVFPSSAAHQQSSLSTEFERESQVIRLDEVEEWH